MATCLSEFCKPGFPVSFLLPITFLDIFAVSGSLQHLRRFSFYMRKILNMKTLNCNSLNQDHSEASSEPWEEQQVMERDSALMSDSPRFKS